jgi:[protein-PII] uridylyltransferase
LPNSVTQTVALIEESPVPICFNQIKFHADISSSKSVIGIFKDALEALEAQYHTRFKEGESARGLIYDKARIIDCIMHYAWHQFSWSDNISLIAIGGYGRGELHPKSDIDLLLLLNNDPDPKDYESSQEFLTLLWDIGLNIGHSVRTLDQCLEMVRKDVTVATSILESRLLQGPKDLFKSLKSKTEPGKIWSNKSFFQAKFNEQQQRHEKYNDTEYNLEPNVKNAPGGLRDIQTIQWVAKHFFNVSTLADLEGKGFFTDAEYAALITGEEYLWKVRYGLHMVANRAEERLLFGYQRELAELFGYKDQDSKLAIEQFMQHYYRVVLSVRELNDVLLQFLDEAIINKSESNSVTPINDRFQLRGNFIEVVHNKIFEEEPSALLEIFVLIGYNENIKGIRASTIRIIRESRHFINDAFRDNIQNKQLFLNLLKSPHLLVTQLRRMKRYGILGRYLPEFDLIIGQMQHDLFHIYTVDDHTLNLLEFLRRFLYPSSIETFPLISKLMHSIAEPELLYITGLYHDIAKGRGGDHSILGAEEAIHFCERHGLSNRQTHLISWLVEKHLIMSSTSQKKDLSDPEVIHEFAKMVGDQSHLDHLFILTVADMNATNPDIWNNWRESLLNQLYNETKRALNRGLENPIDKEDCIAETQTKAMEIIRQTTNLDEQAVWELWQTSGDDYFLRENAEDIVWHTKAILTQQDNEKPIVLIDDNTLNGTHKVTQIFIRAPLGHNIFAAVTSALDQLQLNIQDARIYGTVSGYAMDTFYVLDENNYPIDHSPKTIKKIISSITNELKLINNYSDIIKRRIPRQLKYFTSPTRTSISNDLSHEHTILEIFSPDRPGLLALLARIFAESKIELVTAKITTLGERVEDVFFITDSEGNRISDPKLCEELQTTIQQRLDAKVVL